MIRRSALLILTVLLPVLVAFAGEPPPDLKEWQRMQVQENGRVLPLDTYARNLLLTFSGKSTFERKPASYWLARVFFTPDQTRGDKVFLVNNPEVLEALGLDAHERGRFSFEQLEPTFTELTRLAQAAMQIEAKERTPVDGEIIRLFSTVQAYNRLSRAFEFVLPQPELAVRDAQLRTELGLAEGAAPSVLDLITKSQKIIELLGQQREIASDQWTPYQQEVARLGMTVRMATRQLNNLPPSLLPTSNEANAAWRSPSEALLAEGHTGTFGQELALLADLARAFQKPDGVAFAKAAGAFNAAVSARLAGTPKPAKIGLEVGFNQFDPFYRSEILYGMAFLLALLAVAIRAKWAQIASAALLVIALLPHTFGIIARMVIMHRPPVTNLYTTFLFVGWVCVLLGLAMEWLQRNRLGLIVASASGLALLMTAARFADGDDTMGVMVAVLDSNFWLATHVVTISIGYAGCCAAGLLGHIYLLQALRRSPTDAGLLETYRAVFGLQAFGLIFAFVGTMLGGVWADQSWGRFWGWDPKENGALVIVLWSATLFHARIGRMIGNLGFAAGSVFGVIAVLLAWLGVNLLGVGLHSYGFTSGIARGLFIACAFEVAFVAGLVPFAKRNGATATPARS